MEKERGLFFWTQPWTRVEIEVLSDLPMNAGQKPYFFLSPQALLSSIDRFVLWDTYSSSSYLVVGDTARFGLACQKQGGNWLQKKSVIRLSPPRYLDSGIGPPHRATLKRFGTGPSPTLAGRDVLAG